MTHDHARLKEQFLLNPDITFLNFGSFGACPRPVFEDYQKWQLALERDPVQFITVTGLQHLKASREALAAYVNCGADDLVYVTNPSYAVNIVAKSFPLETGDEVLTTGLEYGACDRTWAYYCAKKGARWVRQNISLPLVSKEQFVEEFFRGATSRTKAVFISQVTSTTGLLLPVKEIAGKAREKGLVVMIDGAHVPGHIPLDIAALDPDIYTGACHKWMMAPKGCSFLYVKRELQPLFDPLVISWGYQAVNPSHSRFLDYHQTQGTRDFSAFLAVPAAIRFMKENNWDRVAAHCRTLVTSNADRFCDLLSTSTLAPLHHDFIGQMISLPLNTTQPEKLQRTLYDEYQVEIPVMRHGQQVFIRYSINGFNSQHDLDRLFYALEDIGKKSNLVNG